MPKILKPSKELCNSYPTTDFKFFIKEKSWLKKVINDASLCQIDDVN